MTATDTPPTDVYFDPYDLAINADPYPTFHRLMEEAPVYHNDTYDFWAISRHADCEAALRDWQHFSNAKSNILDIIKAGVELPPGIVLFEDPPVHTMHRGLMSRVFTPRRMAALEDQIRAFCVECLDPFGPGDEFDFAADLGAKMPMRVIGMLLGIPVDDQEAIRQHTDDTLRTQPGKPMAVTQENIANGEMFGEYIEWRAEHPSDDLMTQLLTAEFEDEHGELRRLSRPEVLTYCQVIAGAGNETTGRLITWIGKVLAEHPDARRELGVDPSLIPSAVEELLRYEPIGPGVARVVTEDVELHGRTIPEGAAVLVLVGAAARDPRRWTEPDRFDIRRDEGAHLTFGFGLHFCLGAALARVEGRVALDELLKRFPEWEIDLSRARLAPTTTVRGWETLPAVLR